MVGNAGAFAYSSGSIGDDIGYLQCGVGYAAASQPGAAFVGISRSAASKTVVHAARALPSGRGGAWWSVPQQNPPTGTHPGAGGWVGANPLIPSFGIVGVDSGFPFFSGAPGNPCLSGEYHQTPNAGLYINTGYDPSYTDSSHTTASCATQSMAIAGTSDQQKAWAVGCSEAQQDYGYASGKGIASPRGWWLDVETANSWCGQHGVSCDLSLNQYTIQGIIDTFTHIGALPIGIYSNRATWSAIVGNLPVSGASSDWVASGTNTAQQAATYCSSGDSFSGALVSLVQFVTNNNSVDRDYAC
jgi:hypothetical protein